MPTPAKTLVVSIVAAMTFAFSVAPADAIAPQADPLEAASVQPALTSQSLSTSVNSLETSSLDSLLSATEYTFSAHSFDVDLVIEKARSEIGTSRATGWDQPGECISSVYRWLGAAGVVTYPAGDPVKNYSGAGATRLTIENALPGDVVQYEHLTYPHSWVTGVHTLLIVGVNDDGTFHIIESNVPYGSGLVTENKSWVPAPPPGFQAVVWRF